jgi:hypothetical protein
MTGASIGPAARGLNGTCQRQPQFRFVFCKKEFPVAPRSPLRPFLQTRIAPTCIAAEARAKIVYERLINFCRDAGSRDALQFLMTREITHMRAFTAALESMGKPPFVIGRIAPTPKLVDQFFNDSTWEGDYGDLDARGPWNEGTQPRMKLVFIDSPCCSAACSCFAKTPVKLLWGYAHDDFTHFAP